MVCASTRRLVIPLKFNWQEVFPPKVQSTAQNAWRWRFHYLCYVVANAPKILSKLCLCFCCFVITNTSGRVVVVCWYERTADWRRAQIMGRWNIKTYVLFSTRHRHTIVKWYKLNTPLNKERWKCQYWAYQLLTQIFVT